MLSSEPVCPLHIYILGALDLHDRCITEGTVQGAVLNTENKTLNTEPHCTLKLIRQPHTHTCSCIYLVVCCGKGSYVRMCVCLLVMGEASKAP